MYNKIKSQHQCFTSIRWSFSFLSYLQKNRLYHLISHLLFDKNVSICGCVGNNRLGFHFRCGVEIEIWEHQNIFCKQNINYSQVPCAICIYRQCLNKVFGFKFTQIQKRFHPGSIQWLIFKLFYFPMYEWLWLWFILRNHTKGCFFLEPI